MNLTTLEKLHYQQINKPVDVNVGDTVKVHYKIKEGNKERIQIYEGVIIAIQGKGAAKAVVVRRISYDVGVERVFPFYSPNVEKIEKVRSGKVRRAKLYYQRGQAGKKNRLAEIKRKSPVDSVFERAQEFQKANAPAPAPVEEPAAAASEEAAPEAAPTE